MATAFDRSSGGDLGNSASSRRTLQNYPAGVPRRLEYPDLPAWGLLELAARSVPDRAAARFLDWELSYAELWRASEGLAGWLQSLGLEPGSRVGILLPNMAEYSIALNGIWRAGLIAVALSPLSVAEEIAAQLRATDCRIVVCLDVLLGLLSQSPELEMTVLASLQEYLPAWKRVGYLAARWHRTGRVYLGGGVRQEWIWNAIRTDRRPSLPGTGEGRRPAYILSTGGTTSQPKLVTLSHANVVANAWQQSRWAGATMGEETMLAVLPFFHSYGMSTMLTTGAALGATLIMQPRFEVTRVLTAIESGRPTVFHAVPAILDALNERLRQRAADLSSLKWVISGGASLPVSVAEEFMEHSGALVVEGYGLSEASPVTHVGPLDGSNQLGTVGLPLPDTACRIVDPENGDREMPLGEVGELLVRGPQVMLGYWQNPEATARVLRDGWLSTGDLARIDEHGFYRIVDRKKDLIITSGFNVYPADVEAVLRRFEGVADVAVVGVPDAHRGEQVKAFVVMRPGVPWDEAGLDAFCREHLACHRRPRLWERVDDLPRNFLGKVLRRHLREVTEVTRSAEDAA